MSTHEARDLVAIAAQYLSHQRIVLLVGLGEALLAPKLRPAEWRKPQTKSGDVIGQKGVVGASVECRVEVAIVLIIAVDVTALNGFKRLVV
jgi:hypothetical protein